MTITIEEYFAKPHSELERASAQELLTRVGSLLAEARSANVYDEATDPDTGTCISGARGGDGDGGFRTPASTTGAPGSAHRAAAAVDVYDVEDRLDTWLDTFENGAGGNTKLAQHGLYREHPSKTPGWCHLQTRAPGSGHRTFYP